MKEIIDYILSLGSTVFVPIVLIIIGLIFGLKILQAIKAGVTVGVGLIGLNLATGIISDQLTPAVNNMVENFGLNLTVLDLGSGTAAGVAFSTLVGTMIIPAVFLLNVILLVIGATKTMNIDIFNYSHYALTGSIVHLLTGNIVIGMGAALIQAAWSLLSADYTAKRVQNELGIEGVSIPQGYASSSVLLFAILEKIYNKFPRLRDSKMDISWLQSKIGMIGDPVIIGIILGIILGLLAGYDFTSLSTLVMNVCGIMILFPRMIKIIVEGLMPLSEAAKGFFNKYFKGKEVYIGLDSAITLGHPTTMVIGTLLIIITVILAVVLPGNKVLPLADLAFASFFICMASIIHRGNMLKTLISGIINMIGILYIATWFAPSFTKLAAEGGFAKDGQSVSALYIGNVFDFIITNIAKFGVIGIIILILITIGGVIFVKQKPIEN